AARVAERAISEAVSISREVIAVTVVATAAARDRGGRGCFGSSGRGGTLACRCGCYTPTGSGTGCCTTTST
ncbi:MAG: hypothetical protein ACRDP7_24000, partial [Trebonia sp.]